MSSGSAGSCWSSTASTAPGRERAPLGQLEQPEPRSALDDDVEPAVVEALDHLGHRREGSDLAQAVVVRVDDAEREAVSSVSPISSR